MEAEEEILILVHALIKGSVNYFCDFLLIQVNLINSKEIVFVSLLVFTVKGTHTSKLEQLVS